MTLDVDRRNILIFTVIVVTVGITFISGVGLGVSQNDAPAADGGPDHGDFIDEDNFNASAPAETCANCHSEAVKDAANSVHFQWRGPVENVEGLEGEELGKRDSMNNFCQGIRNNEKKCGSCHTGYSMNASSEAYFENEANVDCLACHADPAKYPSKTYKIPTAKEDYTEDDLLSAAQSVGQPETGNCITCHANAGGGDQHKIGDLSMADTDPSVERSVHMSSEGADLNCISCHETSDHKISGESVHQYPTENGGVECTQCHTTSEHENDKLNEHTDSVACQSCHIPEFARDLPGDNVDTKTKVNWNWGAVGEVQEVKKEKTDDGKIIVKKPAHGFITFDDNVTPTYRWYNGNAAKYNHDRDTANPDGTTALAEPLGSKSGDAKIYPFKKMTAVQAMDAETNKMLPMNYMGAEDGLWANGLAEDGDMTDAEWDRVLGSEAEAYGLDYSGEVKWVDTEMYLRINHEIPPANNALTCPNCHGEDGRMNWQQLGYEKDPRLMAQEETTTMEETTEAPTEETTAEMTDGAEENAVQTPGFGIGITVLSLLGAALLAIRRHQ